MAHAQLLACNSRRRKLRGVCARSFLERKAEMGVLLRPETSNIEERRGSLCLYERADVPPPVRLRGGFKRTARSTPVVGGILLAGLQKGGCLEPSICHLNEDGALPIRARAFRPDHALVSILSIFFRRRHDYPTLSQPSRIVPKTARLRVMSNTLCSFSERATAASLGSRSGVKWIELAGSGQRPSDAQEQIGNQNDGKLLFPRLYVRCGREDGTTKNSTLNFGSGAAERISPKRIEIRSAFCSVFCSAEARPMRKPNACRRSVAQSLQEENLPASHGTRCNL